MSVDNSKFQSDYSPVKRKTTTKSNVIEFNKLQTRMNSEIFCSRAQNNGKPQGYSVEDPVYPEDMWKDHNRDRYTYIYLLRNDQKYQLMLSTSRSGNGVVYVSLVDNSTKKLIS